MQEEPSYECEFPDCGKKFTTKFSLKRHYYIHSNLKTFRCEFCTKTFALPQYLREHQYTHTNQQPFICGVDGCDETFRQRGKLSLHRRTHETFKKKEYRLLNSDQRLKVEYIPTITGNLKRLFSQSDNIMAHSPISFQNNDLAEKNAQTLSENWLPLKRKKVEHDKEVQTQHQDFTLQGEIIEHLNVKNQNQKSVQIQTDESSFITKEVETQIEKIPIIAPSENQQESIRSQALQFQLSKEEIKEPLIEDSQDTLEQDRATIRSESSKYPSNKTTSHYPARGQREGTQQIYQVYDGQYQMYPVYQQQHLVHQNRQIFTPLAQSQPIVLNNNSMSNPSTQQFMLMPTQKAPFLQQQQQQIQGQNPLYLQGLRDGARLSEIKQLQVIQQNRGQWPTTLMANHLPQQQIPQQQQVMMISNQMQTPANQMMRSLGAYAFIGQSQQPGEMKQISSLRAPVIQQNGVPCPPEKAEQL